MESKKRRHIYITDKCYGKIAKEAAEKQTDKWKILDKALKLYFEKEGDRQEG